MKDRFISSMTVAVLVGIAFALGYVAAWTEADELRRGAKIMGYMHPDGEWVHIDNICHRSGPSQH